MCLSQTTTVTTQYLRMIGNIIAMHHRMRKRISQNISYQFQKLSIISAVT